MLVSKQYRKRIINHILTVLRVLFVFEFVKRFTNNLIKHFKRDRSQCYEDKIYDRSLYRLGGSLNHREQFLHNILPENLVDEVDV